MAQEFRLPDIGEGLAEAEIVRWLVEVGDTVVADQPVVEVETDKAVVEIPTPFGGTVLRLGGEPGEVIEVGEILLVVGSADDDRSLQADNDEPGGVREDETEEEAEDEKAAGAGPTDLPESPGTSHVAAPIVGTLSEEAEVLRPRQAPAERPQTRAKALPVVRKLARDHGVDIDSIRGSGPGGRITREDVMAAVGEEADSASAVRPEARTAAPATEVTARDQSENEPSDVQPSQPKRDPSKRSDTQRERMSRLRRTIASNMSKSWSEIPHVTTFDDIDATRLLETRSALSQRHGTKIPIEALVIKAVLPALDEFPEFNASIDGEELVLHGSRDVGVAVDTPDGLMVAVVADAGSRGVLGLASEVVRLGEGARERSLSPDELSGQTFTVSNIGAVGGGHGTPIVPHGTTAILSVGRAVDRPVARDGKVAVSSVMPLSLSYDHRVIDGAQGRRFMALVMENLEEPALFLAS